MAIYVPIRDIDYTQRIVHTSYRPLSDNSGKFAGFGTQQLEIYTGKLTFTLTSALMVKVPIISYVPKDFSLASYHLRAAEEITTSVITSITSFKSDEDVDSIHAIDRARVKTYPVFFDGVGHRRVLVLIADLVVMNGGIGRVDYQVSVSTMDKTLDDKLFEPPTDATPPLEERDYA